MNDSIETSIVSRPLTADVAPDLLLPESSADLPLRSDLLFDALEVYETCIAFYPLLCLSPFLFEDFCAALIANEQSTLLLEIHSAFLRFHVVTDEMKFAEKILFDSDGEHREQVDPTFAVRILSGNYPFFDAAKRLRVLTRLCRMFVESPQLESYINEESSPEDWDEPFCRACLKDGELVICDGCDSCYHRRCAKLRVIPEGDWYCWLCSAHAKQSGIECQLLAKMNQKVPLRIEPLGFDRHGRKYWFLAKRIFIHDRDQKVVAYYTTLPQLYELFCALDSDIYERKLCEEIAEKLDDIYCGVYSTLRRTISEKEAMNEETPTNKSTLLELDNLIRLPKICVEIRDEPEDETVCLPKLVSQLRELLGFDDKKLIFFMWSSQTDQKSLIEMYSKFPYNVYVPQLKNQAKEYFRLGISTNSFRSYVNYYKDQRLAKHIF
ncbi:hypothetical protein M3Y98_00078400 [Aphelenchoides besseyi]|nr:hypothetical protein M3Y98_00078400 [Aphelenchoides besseyi]KAI6198681.1 hypothetical protein M3Y96_00545300 [Aphelenchoides besseyi]